MIKSNFNFQSTFDYPFDYQQIKIFVILSIFVGFKCLSILTYTMPVRRSIQFITYESIITVN